MRDENTTAAEATARGFRHRRVNGFSQISRYEKQKSKTVFYAQRDAFCLRFLLGLLFLQLLTILLLSRRKLHIGWFIGGRVVIRRVGN